MLISNFAYFITKNFSSMHCVQI